MPPAEQHRTESMQEARSEREMEDEWVLRAVHKLQARLATSTRPKKLRKYFKKLSALPITPHILVDTGVRKTVKSLRKHELVGSLARDLTSQWKQLALLEPNAGPGPQDSEDSRSPKRPGDARQKENVFGGPQENWRASGSPWHSPEHGHEEHGEPWDSQTPPMTPRSPERRAQSKKRPGLEASPCDRATSEGGQGQVTWRPTSPHQVSVDHARFPEDPRPAAPGRTPGKGRAQAFHDRTGLPQEGPLDGPQDEQDLLPKARGIYGNLRNQNDGKSADEEFQEPTMSFESYLTYDQPHKRRRKVKHSATAEKGKERQERDAKRWAQTSDSLPNFRLVSANQSEKRQPAEVHSALVGEGCTEAAPVLPDPPMPSVQAHHRPLPAYDLMASFQPEATPLSSPQEEEGAGFTGRRNKSKTQVYSGPRRGYLGPVTSHQQHSRVPGNESSLLGNRGLPHSVLQSALGQRPPDQLYPMEINNGDTLEETDELWRVRCHNEFKGETPKENESWREMYLRLQDAQEQRLQALTWRIRAAHPQETQGRKTKMIFFKSLSDVPRRQEKFGTVAVAAFEKPEFQPAQHPTGSSDTSSDSGSSFPSSTSSCPSSYPSSRSSPSTSSSSTSSSSSYPSSRSSPSASSSSTSSASSYPSSRSSPSASSSSTSSSSSRSSGGSFNPAAQTPTEAPRNTARPHLAPVAPTRRPAAKKPAPLMAKTIKDYKKAMCRR